MVKRLSVLASLIVAYAVAESALAATPEPWRLGFQAAASPVMERINEFHNLLLVIITSITAFVLGLLVYVALRFNEKSNPVPSKTTHNTVLEVLWTAVPVVILMVVAVPSFKLLYFMDRAQNAEMTIKVIGHQWYWSYEYPDQGNFTFDSLMVPDDELKDGQPRLLAVDNTVVVPVDTDIRVLVTSDDVLHAWAVPALIAKLDAVPGRINETWMRINREGTYYGQCSELCGVNHGFMPVAVEAVSKEAFRTWVKTAKKEFARADTDALRVAETGTGAR
ncbi:MAG: cytochrome c oxidase subunit II [Rhodospirillales bacterium]